MCVVTMLAYAGSLSGGFVYEDGVLPVSGQMVRPLLRFSHQATAALFGDTALPQRIVALAWHVLNGLLLWSLARRVVSAGAAVFAAGLFLLHPVQTESVAYLASRPELIAATFVLIALLAVERGALWLAWFCAALAIAGKEMAVMAWLLVPGWAWIRGQVWSPRWVTVWVGTACVALTAFGLVAWQAFGSLWSPWALAAQWAELLRLLWLIPESLVHPSALTIDHYWRWITKPIAALSVCGCLSALALAAWYRSRLALLLIGTPIVALLPRLLLPMPDGLHERHLYIPMIGVSLALAMACAPRKAV